MSQSLSHESATHDELALKLGATFAFTLLTALGANIAVPLPPDGIPMTFQTLVVLLAALGLGPKLGMLSMALYITMGAFGAAVFSDGGAGFGVLLGQSGGYIFGFILCQPVVCKLAKARDGRIRSWPWLLLAVLAGNAVIFLIGVPWLAYVRDFSLSRALTGGFYPFIPGLILKSAITVIIGMRIAPWSARRGWW